MRKFIFYITLILLLGSFAFWIKSIILRPSNLPIQKIIIYSDVTNLKRPLLKQIITPIIHNSSLLNVDIQQLKIAIEKIPGISYVDIDRIWPDQLNVQIRAWIPIAIWNRTQFLNAYGEIFSSPYPTKEKLPNFFGDNKKSLKILDYYQRINEILTSTKSFVKMIKLSASGVWEIILNNNVKLKLGYGDILNKIKRFSIVYPKLVASHSMLPKTVDLRYKHGIAVRW